MIFTTVAIGGFTSNSGKTGLLCDLLGEFPGWEAIKVSRGHYRSCGKDPHACCIAPLLGEEPTVRTGRAETYATGKDTGRYWDAGASNVHWVIATDRQIARGIEIALSRVRAAGVFVEGNSILRDVAVDFVVMAARADGEIKPTARRVLAKTSAFYLSGAEGARARERFMLWRDEFRERELIDQVPIYTRDDLPRLVARLRAIHGAVAA
jgi:molybdopterin-guanine dinucleotide biosynthesis protein